MGFPLWGGEPHSDPSPQNIGLDSRPPNGLPGIQAKTQVHGITI